MIGVTLAKWWLQGSCRAGFGQDCKYGRKETFAVWPVSFSDSLTRFRHMQGLLDPGLL